MELSHEEDEDKNVSRQKYGFKPQKTIIYNKLLPYANELPAEAVVHLKNIKENIAKAIILRDVRPSCLYWISRLSRYIKVYGLCFSKEDHILFVKLAYELVIIPDQEFWVTGKFAQLLNILLKKRELISPEDLQLPWKPLVDTYMKLFQSSYKDLGMIILPKNAEILFKSTIRFCRPYFPQEATGEMLDRWQPLFCPYDISMHKAISYLELFLPTMLSSSKAQYGYKLWLNDLLNLWNIFHNEPTWGSTLFCLFARLAWQNIGYISWEEHLSTVFTRILWQFHLPVYYKKATLTSRKGLDTWAVAMFIIANLGGGSKTQSLLDQLFKALESYFHPSNTGYWTKHLNDFQMKLSHSFVQRLHIERYRKPSWITEVPEEKKLTEDDITAFVKCLQPAANLSVFAKVGSYEAGIVLNRLTLLRPEIIIPPILDQLYSSLETMTEPHRLTAALQCVVRVARPLVLGGKTYNEDLPNYPEGPTHVIPLLILSLPGIDPNDITKCMVTFQFIATFASLIPIVDCSSAVEEVEGLTKVEQQLCLQTAEFEDFVMQFMTRAFALIESSALEQTTHLDRENSSMNLEENMVEIGLSSAFKAILTQSHPKIFEVALDRLVNFTKGRCLETKVAGKFIAAMCRSASKVNSEKAMKAFVPSVCKLILVLTDRSDILKEENLDDELLFNLLLLSELCQSKGKCMMEYIPLIKEVLHKTLHLHCRKGYKLASSILRHMLWSLHIMVSGETKSSIFPWNSPFKEFLPIRHWGEAGDIYNLKLEWNQPSAEEEEAITGIIREFLTPELRIIKQVTEGDSSISRDRLHQSLNITQDILYAGASLPMWNEEPIDLIQMSVDRDTKPIKLHSTTLNATLDDPEFPTNVRLAVAQTILHLVDALLSRESDDTKAMNYATTIYYSVTFFYGVMKDEFEGRWKSFQRVKQALSNSIIRKKQHIRPLLIERTILQYEIRVIEGSMPAFTQTHKRLLLSLFKLSTSHYSEVRKKAQCALCQLFRQFPYSYKLALPSLIEILKKDATIFHKEIKGALYVVQGFKEKSLIVRRDWDTLNLLCPALVAAQYSEKPSVIKLYDLLLKTFSRYFELFAIEVQGSEGSVETARLLISSKEPEVENSFIDPALEAAGIEGVKLKSNKNLAGYHSLIHQLVVLYNSKNLHWRREELCLTILGILVRPDVNYPAEAIEAITRSTINDSIILRKLGLWSLPMILKNQKQIRKKIKVDPYTEFSTHPFVKNFQPGDNRPDNKWLQYNQESLQLTKEEWNNKIFIHKAWIGWYSWSKELEVYAPAKDQPSLNRPYDDLKDSEKALYDFFSNKDKVDQLIGFLSMEEMKGVDKFDARKLYIFKGLFSSFGDTFLPLLKPHLERLVADSQESSQRCAAEIIAGMLRGSKHWPYESSMVLLNLACSLLKVAMTKILNETIVDWGKCIMYIGMDRDPNRMGPIIEMLLEDPVRQEDGSFLASSRLLLCQLFFDEHKWRVADCYHRLYEALEPHLDNFYKSIRDKIGVCLYDIFKQDERFSGGGITLSPHRHQFVERVLPRLAILIQESGSGCISSAELSPIHHPSSEHVGGDTHLSLLNPSLRLSPVVQSILSDFDESSRPESPKDLQEASLGPSIPSLKESMEISSLYDDGEVKGQLPIVPLAFPGNGFQPGDSEERKGALRLMDTVCKYITCYANYIVTSLAPETYQFLPHLCQLESLDSDQELRNNCICTLEVLSHTVINPTHISFVLSIIKSICFGGWWRAKIATLSFLQVVVFNNMFTIVDSGGLPEVRDIVMNALTDGTAEVRQMAAKFLSGLFHCHLVEADEVLLSDFILKLNRSKRKRDVSTDLLLPLSAEAITEKHIGALGLCAFINSNPYEVPPSMPLALVTISEHINDPQPISNDIKQTLSNFKRTHHDNWQDHKKKFTSDELSVLMDVLVSPSYYA